MIADICKSLNKTFKAGSNIVHQVKTVSFFLDAHALSWLSLVTRVSPPHFNQLTQISGHILVEWRRFGRCDNQQMARITLRLVGGETCCLLGSNRDVQINNTGHVCHELV